MRRIRERSEEGFTLVELIVVVSLMSLAYLVSAMGTSMSDLMLAPAVFAFGLVAFGFLGMGPVTIAVDSYGPVTDNAQSVFELSVIETVPGIQQELKRDFGLSVNFEKAKALLEENDHTHFSAADIFEPHQVLDDHTVLEATLK